MNRPTSLEQRNTKPFWKEPSLKHVWARANTGAKTIVYAFLYIAFCGFIARFINPVSALYALGVGIGGVIGWAIRDLCEPRWIKDETGEYQRIEFGEDE